MKNKIKPPRLADRLLEWYCQRVSVEDLHGDAEELFYHDLKRTTPARAKLNYWRHVISLMLSYAVKRRKANALNHQFSSTAFNFHMLRNYFLIAARNLVKHKFFTIINVVGLAVGMSIGLLLIAMLSFLWTYDDFHEKKDTIYRIITKADDKVSNREYASAPAPLADRLKNEYSRAQMIVRISATLTAEAVYDDKQLPLRGYFVDPEFLNVFTFPLLKGNAATAFQKPNTLVITEKAARKMFGENDPLGKVITMGNFGDFEVTGLLKDVPKNSHMQFEVLASYQSIEKRAQNLISETKLWKEFRDSYVYLLLPQTSTEETEKYLNKIAQEVYKNDEKFSAEFELQALNSIAPGRELYNQIGPDWGYASLSIFMVLSILILLPACFNYTNISISRALKRMKEIGLRKVMGGQRNQIFFQFIIETIIITLIALGLSYYLFSVARHEFLSIIVGGAETLSLDINIQTLSYFLLFAVFVGAIAGIVPALYFSKLSPIQALKGKPVGKRSGVGFRKVLIVSQFALSLGFITGVVIVLNQYRQTMSYDFGFQQTNILDVPLQGTNPDIFRTEFSRLSAAQDISMSSNIVGTSTSGTVYLKNATQADSVEVVQLYVDDHYLVNLNLTLLAGTNFTQHKTSENQVIVNEEFLKAFKIPEPSSALGHSFILPDQNEVTVIGVVRNFHYGQLREPIKSFFFRYDPSQWQYANIKVVSADMIETFAQMEIAWKTFAGEKKFTARFFEDEIEEAYSFYFAMVKICGLLGFLAITISCLGLLGMVVFTVENRTKEVGIRKVIGASTVGIIVLLSKDFLKLIFIAAAVAMPLTYLFFDKIYLRMQSYKIPIGAGEIIISIVVMMVLGLATILSQTAKAAKANPVDSLRYE